MTNDHPRKGRQHTLQNQEETPVDSNKRAYTPPPACAKPTPKLLGFFSPTIHPWGFEQSVSIVSPVCGGLAAWKHPGVVCNATWLFGISLMASMMSISPARGHVSSIPYIQNEGQTYWISKDVLRKKNRTFRVSRVNGKQRRHGNLPSIHRGCELRLLKSMNQDHSYPMR